MNIKIIYRIKNLRTYNYYLKNAILIGKEHNTIKMKPNYGGFFFCCSLKLYNIINFINFKLHIPNNVDSSDYFNQYKYNNTEDITYDYFEHYDNMKNIDIIYSIKYDLNNELNDYSKLDFIHICPLIQKYFSPSNNIKKIIDNIEKKYKLDFNNILAVYYRGTDKLNETKLASFEEFYNKILEIINIDKNINILIQTDTAQFMDYINDKNLKNTIVIKENIMSYSNNGIHNEKSTKENYYDMLNLLSTFIIISKCKYILCSSGNCSLWIMFYRNNNKNVLQYLNGIWYNTIF